MLPESINQYKVAGAELIRCHCDVVFWSKPTQIGSNLGAALYVPMSPPQKMGLVESCATMAPLNRYKKRGVFPVSGCQPQAAIMVFRLAIKSPEVAGIGALSCICSKV